MKKNNQNSIKKNPIIHYDPEYFKGKDITDEYFEPISPLWCGTKFHSDEHDISITAIIKCVTCKKCIKKMKKGGEK